VTESSAYEIEKETGRGKRKKIRNRLFDSDEEIIRRNNKKSISAKCSFQMCIGQKNSTKNRK